MIQHHDINALDYYISKLHIMTTSPSLSLLLNSKMCIESYKIVINKNDFKSSLKIVFLFYLFSLSNLKPLQ